MVVKHRVSPDQSANHESSMSVLISQITPSIGCLQAIQGVPNRLNSFFDSPSFGTVGNVP